MFNSPDWHQSCWRLLHLDPTKFRMQYGEVAERALREMADFEACCRNGSVAREAAVSPWTEKPVSNDDAPLGDVEGEEEEN